MSGGEKRAEGPQGPSPQGARRAIVLLSGGMDSTTCLAIARDRGYDCFAMTFSYGQRHAVELAAARRVASDLGAREQLTVEIDLRLIGGSALTDGAIDVPKARGAAEIAEGIPVTYVPARNTIFLSFALAWAEVLQVEDIFIGVNALDYSGYPDCRPEFIQAFENLAAAATRLGDAGRRIAIHAPLMKMDKAEIVRVGARLGVDFSRTHTCYDPLTDGGPCGTCDACQLRRRGFAAAGVEDPLPYPAPHSP